MKPLTLEELTAPDLFAELRDDHFEQHVKYLDRCRRVRIGPAVTMVFENRQTLWFRVQELVRVARLTDERRVQAELTWYNRLLPKRNQLQAAVWVAEPGRRPGRSLDAVRQAVSLGRIGFRSACGDEVPGMCLTDRVGDRLIGLAQWYEFHFTASDRDAFADYGRRWWLFVEGAGYQHDGLPLEPEVHESLLADLEESDEE